MEHSAGLRKIARLNCAGGGQVVVDRQFAYIGHMDPGVGTCIAGIGLDYRLRDGLRLSVFPTLAPVSGSSEILAGLATRKLFTELKNRDPGRLLIVDLPPMLLSDDALMVAPLLDAVVLVVNERRTRREDVIRVVELLGNTRIVGTVLNRSSESELRAY